MIFGLCRFWRGGVGSSFTRHSLLTCHNFNEGRSEGGRREIVLCFRLFKGYAAVYFVERHMAIADVRQVLWLVIFRVYPLAIFVFKNSDMLLFLGYEYDLLQTGYFFIATGLVCLVVLFCRIREDFDHHRRVERGLHFCPL